MTTARIGTMFGDLLQSLVKTPATQLYPNERQASPERLRGRLVWEPQECIGCSLCAKDCPAFALEVLTVDKKERRFVVRYLVDRCTFCAQCVESCRRGCLKMSNEKWELASSDRGDFIFHFGRPADVEFILAGEPAAGVEAAGGDAPDQVA